MRVGREKTEGILTESMDNLTGMGYSLKWREEVLYSTMKGYIRILKRVEKGEILRNRKGTCTLQKRRFMKLLGRSEWYKYCDEESEELEVPVWSQSQNQRSKTGRRSQGKDNRYTESV